MSFRTNLRTGRAFPVRTRRKIVGKYITTEQWEQVKKDFNRFELYAISQYLSKAVGLEEYSPILAREEAREVIANAYKIHSLGFEVTHARLRVPP